MSDEEPKNPGGRPRKELSEKDWKQLEQLAAIHCTGDEMASIFDMHYDTLERRIKERGWSSFSDWFNAKSAHGKMSLRRRQFTLAQKNASMSIWLGKQWLGQVDKSEVQQTAQIVQINYTDEQLDRAIELAKRFKETKD